MPATHLEKIASEDRQRLAPAIVAGASRWRRSSYTRATIAGDADTAIFLIFLDTTSRGSHHNNVIRRDRNICKMEAKALAVISAG